MSENSEGEGAVIKREIKKTVQRKENHMKEGRSGVVLKRRGPFR